MKKAAALLLAICLLAGCAPQTGGAKDGVWPVPDGVDTGSEDPVTYLYLQVCRNGEYDRLINVWTEDSGAGVLFQADCRKECVFEEAALSAISAALEEADMGRFDGAEGLGDGDGWASMHVEFKSGKTWNAHYNLCVPEDFEAAFGDVAEFFEGLTAQVPEADVSLRVDGDVDAEILKELQDIYSGTVSFSELWVGGADGDNAVRLSLSDTSGILAAAVCSPEMDTQPYELQIVRLAPGADPESVAAGFRDGADWDKWACVAPTTGWIGIKGNLVMCVLGNADATDTADSAMELGWREYCKLKR